MPHWANNGPTAGVTHFQNIFIKGNEAHNNMLANIFLLHTPFPQGWVKRSFFMPQKELWEAFSNHTVRPSRFVSGAYLLYSLR